MCVRGDAAVGRIRSRLATMRRAALRAPLCNAVALLMASLVMGCGNEPSKEEQEAAKNTFACELQGERLVLRLERGEARMLMPGGDRVVLYQIPTASGVRFSNGNLELRGKGVELTLVDTTTATQAPLVG